jgi:myo-inositol-1(or 4)-monophosphatase
MNERDIAIEAALAAVALQRARPAHIGHKGAVDLVTEIDVACEAAIRSVLARHTPDVPVLGEEGGGAAGATTRWIVDPLDGTTNFVHGFPFWCVSIALERDGVLEAGVVIDAVRNEIFAAQRGQGATRDGERIAVSAVRTLDQALLGTGFPVDSREKAAFYLKFVQRALERTRGIRRAGAAALDLAMVACGRLDAFWEFRLSPWDVAAGRLLVAEAGGRCTAHTGAPLPGNPRLDPLASNGWLHEEMIALLGE